MVELVHTSGDATVSETDKMNRVMRKPVFAYMCETKAANQRRGNHTSVQSRCFRYLMRSAANNCHFSTSCFYFVE